MVIDMLIAKPITSVIILQENLSTSYSTLILTSLSQAPPINLQGILTGRYIHKIINCEYNGMYFVLRYELHVFTFLIVIT